MAEMLSPGVYVTEIDASLIAPTVSNSICVFAGDFDQGPVDAYTLITSVDELISFHGLPGDKNYNDWYQAYNFLQSIVDGKQRAPSFADALHVAEVQTAMMRSWESGGWESVPSLKKE